MNNVSLIGRLVRDPELRRAGETSVCTFTLAVDRPGKEKQADFPKITVFGKQAENCDKQLTKGKLCGVKGRIQTGSYTNRDGVKVYTTDVIVEEQEFAESKAASEQSASAYGARPAAAPSAPVGDGFMNIPDGLDEELPFS